MIRLAASRVVVGFLVMMMMLMMLSTKVLFFIQWTGLLSGGPTGNSHVSALVLQAHLSVPDIVTLIMSRHGRAGAHSPLERTGWSYGWS